MINTITSLHSSIYCYSDTQDDSKPTTPAVVPDEKSEDMSPLKSESVPPSTGMSHEEEDMDVMLVKYPGEMPIIDTQKVGRVMSATKERPGSRPTSGTKRPTDSAKGTRKTVLLTYLHKNKYDDKGECLGFTGSTLFRVWFGLDRFHCLFYVYYNFSTDKTATLLCHHK